MTQFRDPRPPATYADGVGGTRCAVCLSLLRDGAGAPTVSVQVDDLEEIACLLVDYVDCPQVWEPTIRRIEQATGRTVAQMKADLRDRFRDAVARGVDAK